MTLLGPPHLCNQKMRKMLHRAKNFDWGAPLLLLPLDSLFWRTQMKRLVLDVAATLRSIIKCSARL